MRGPLFRVLHKGEVPEPPKNIVIHPPPSTPVDEEQILDSLDPDNPYDWKKHGL